MKVIKHDERFFESTRGRIVTMLRESTSSTVEELATKLGLTDNGVRAHLATLERDGLVRQKGVRRALRKPHFTYSLTHEAEQLFPKAYDTLFNHLIAVLKIRLLPEAIESILREVGRRLATQEVSGAGEGDLKRRTQRAVKVMEGLGGSARIETVDEKLFLRSESCPMSRTVVAHPEVCQLAEALLSEIIGAPVHERCDRQEHPRCLFEIDDEGIRSGNGKKGS